MRIFDWFYSDDDLPLTNKQRREIRRSAWKLWMRCWRNKTLYLIIVLLYIGVTAAIAWRVDTVQQLVLFFMIETGLWFLVFWIIRQVSVAPLGRRLIRERGIDVCLRCGYWLRGLGKDVTECPECGWRREGSDEPKG